LQIGNCGIRQLKQIGSKWVWIGLECIGSNPFRISSKASKFFCSSAFKLGLEHLLQKMFDEVVDVGGLT
jgi:hypothetical protein